MINKTILRQTYAKISGLPNEEVNMAIDSTIYVNETTFKDAIKKMATKDDIREIKADVRAATKDMATKADVEKMARVIIMWMVGVFVASTVIIVTAVRLMIKFL